MELRKRHRENPHFSSIWGYLWIPRPQIGLGMTAGAWATAKKEGAAKAGPYRDGSIRKMLPA
jgi:hypothetical protein